MEISRKVHTIFILTLSLLTVGLLILTFPEAESLPVLGKHFAFTLTHNSYNNEPIVLFYCHIIKKVRSATGVHAKQ